MSETPATSLPSSKLNRLMLVPVTVGMVILYAFMMKDLDKAQAKAEGLRSEIDTLRNEVTVLRSQLQVLQSGQGFPNLDELWKSPGIRSIGEAEVGLPDDDPQEAIAGADLIVVAKWRNEEREHKCIIQEILKDNGEVQFLWKPGDEYAAANQPVEKNKGYGEGVVLFFDSEVRGGYKRSCNMFAAPGGYKIPAFKSITLAEFKKLVAQ